MGDLSFVLSEPDKSHLKINKIDVKVVNRTLGEVDMIDLWRKLNGDRKEYTFFLVVHGIHTKIDHVLVHKSEDRQR